MKNTRLSQMLGLTAALVISACSHTKKDFPSSLDSERAALHGALDSQSGGAAGRDGIWSSSGPSLSRSFGPVKKVDYGEVVIGGVRLNNTTFDYPITINSRVEFWVDYFTGRGREAFTKYLARSEFFIPFIHPILEEYKVPEDLVFLAMIESGFHNHARSRAKAVGPWQFISATGKRYGLQIDWWVDHRRDTRKSTLAAVAYLKDLYQMFGSWELASAAYNAGEMKIKRGMERYATADFWALARHQFLRPETRDYVPKIIAAALISKNRELFGFAKSVEKLEEGVALAPDGSVVKVEKEDSPSAVVSATGELAAKMANSDDDVADKIEDQLEEVLSLPVTVADINVKAVPTPQVHKDGSVSGETLAEFEVPSPADLFHIAHAAGLSYQTVKSLNPEVLRWVTPPTQKTYRIKLPESVKDKFLSTYNAPGYDRTVRFLAYRAKAGDSVPRIARRFGFQPDPIEHLNRISRHTPLKQGRVLILPLPADRSRDLAVSDTKDPVEKRRSRKRPQYKRSSFKVSREKRETARGRIRKISLGQERS